MIVVIANDLPPAVRGRMKVWFIEPMPNVFVSGVKDTLAEKVIRFLLDHCPYESGLMIFNETKGAPGYDIRCLGEHKKSMVNWDGFKLVVEKIRTTPRDDDADWADPSLDQRPPPI